jgi:cyclopropane fatty-acyl-phospholipid synthase-like methyltransferase
LTPGSVDAPVLDPSGVIPDKMVFKSTTTLELRAFLRELGDPGKTLLEIGCNVGFTTLTVASEFGHIVAVDISRPHLDRARENLRGHRHVEFVRGTSARVPTGAYDVVFIDAMHTYEAVRRDFFNVARRNTLSEYDVVFHDYGLPDDGVRRFVAETFSDFELVGAHDGWNPTGAGTAGPEAAWVRVRASDLVVPSVSTRDRVRELLRLE